MTTRVIRVVLDPKGVQQGARQTQAALTGTQRRVAGLQKAFTALTRVAGALALVFAAKQILQTADQFAQLQNRLRVVTDSTEELASVTERLFEISQSTRQEFDSVVALYSRASIAAGELGASQDELFRLVEITGKALAVQGGAASESAGALRQLSQSFSSGIVRAEEFNSLLEGAFPLALAAAEGLDAAGGSVGRLRNLITQGEVTSREFFEAILKGGAQLDEQFAQTVATLSQSFTVLGNSFLSFVGQIDSSLAGTSSLATAVIGLASTLDNFGAALQGTLDEQEELSGFFEVITVGVIGVGAGFGTLFDILNLGRLIIVDVVESLAGAAAAAVQALQGNFAGALEILNSNAFDDTQAAATDFFEDFETRVDRASDKISEVLIPSFRAAADAAEDATGDEGGGGPTGPTDEELRALEQLQASQADFLEGLLTQEAALAEASQSGRDYNEVLEELNLASLAAGGETTFLAQAIASVAAGAEGFEFDAQQAIEEIRRLEAELEAAAEAQERLDEAREERTDILADLEQENEALRAATDAGIDYATALEILAITRAAQGDEVFLEDALRLRAANEELREGLDEAEDQITDFSERARSNAQDILSGFLSDPAAEGLDQLPGQFAGVLADLASEALASEIFSLLGGLGGGSDTGFLSLIGGFFGGAQGGAKVGGGDFGVVGEAGPELFVAPQAGNIVPMQAAAAAPQVTVSPQIINVRDPSEIPAAMQSAQGEEVVLNIIKQNPDVMRQVGA